MEATKTTRLQDNENVKALFQIIGDPKMEANYSDFFQICNYVNTMEQQLDKVFAELDNVKQQLKDTKKDEATVKPFETMETKVLEVKERLNSVKEKIIEGSKNGVKAFKEKGLSALNKAMDFAGINNALKSLNSSLDKSIDATKQSISKIDEISGEWHEIGKHVKGFGNAVTGKDDSPEKKENGKLNALLKKPCRSSMNIMAGMQAIAEKGINKLEHLEERTTGDQVKSLQGEPVKEDQPEADKSPEVLPETERSEKSPPEMMQSPGMQSEGEVARDDATSSIYCINIKETLSRDVEVEAASEEEALKKVEDGYVREEYVLDSSDFAGHTFSIANQMAEGTSAEKEPIGAFENDSLKSPHGEETAPMQENPHGEEAASTQESPSQADAARRAEAARRMQLER